MQLRWSIKAIKGKKSMIEMNVHNKNVVSFHYDITMACNNRCSYCYMLPHLDNALKVNRDTIDNVKNSIKDLQNRSPDLKISFVFVGGEPLLVLDEVREIMEYLDGPNINFQIFTNANFKPGGSKIGKVLKLRETFKNFTLKVSWHDSSNQDYVKANIKACEDFTCLTFLVQDENFDLTFERYKWVISETTAEYNFEEIRDQHGNSFFTKPNDPRYIELLQNCHDKSLVNTIGDKTYNLIESQSLLDISRQYYTICQVSEMCIRYNGDIVPMCFNQSEFGNVRDGINIVTKYCDNYHCRNVTCTYKKLGKKK
jgi:MoaA/NifB/PqqE/SkfB family radical SAM enzyme